MKQRMHERIIDGARRVFFALGYDGTKLDELADRLGIAKKTIYNHFSSKEELVMAVLDHDLAEWLRQANAVVDRSDAEIGQVFLRLYAHAMDALRRRSTLFPSDPPTRRQELRTQTERAFKDQLVRIVVKAAELGAASGDLLPSCDPELLAHVLVNAAAGVGPYCDDGDVPYEPYQLMTESIKMVLAGQLTPQGRRTLDELGFMPRSEE
jgi:AcrR family transcriptional regulator